MNPATQGRRTEALRAASVYFAQVTEQAASISDLRAHVGPSLASELSDPLPRDILIAVFREVWRAINVRALPILEHNADPRDALGDVFSCVFDVFFHDEPHLGKCVIVESHRYDKTKIAQCFGIPEYTDFLKTVTDYVQQHVDSGEFVAVNASALVELLLSMQDGMMFAWLMRDDFAYPATFTRDDFDAVARILVSSVFLPSVEQSKQYYDSVADKYDALYTDGVSLAENAIVGDMLASATPSNGTVLDLGCGSGLAYELLARRLTGTFTYVGIDISPGMVRAARHKYLGVHGCKFSVMNMEDLSLFHTASFDLVVSLFGSFSHVLNWAPAIAEIARVLRPGGKLFLMVYSRYSLRNITQAIFRLSPGLLSEVRPYEIRKTSGSIFADARFYTSASISLRFPNFSNIRVSGLNCTLELPFWRPGLRASENADRAQGYLRREMKRLSRCPNLCHSLIIQGEKRS